MVPPDDDDHDCGWKAYAKAQDAKIVALVARMEDLERRAAGHKSEKRKASKLPPAMPPVRPEPQETAAKRAAEAELRRAQLHVEVTDLPVPDAERRCPSCERDLRRVGAGKLSSVIEFVRPHFRRRVFRRETLSCRCGHIVTAPPPDRVGDKTRYAPSFVAHLVVSKCNDAIPQYRLEKAYKQIGIPIARSTMCDLFHRAAGELRPLYAAALALVPAALDVHADETSIRQQGLDRRAFLWDFVTPEVIVYRYAPSRSGETAKQVLGDSTGRLVVDQFTGYNAVTKPGGRLRAGCLAHARRKLFEQREHPETKEALDLIGAIYVVEHDAKAAGIVGTDEHLALRRSRSRPIFAALLRWGRRHRHAFEPRSGLGRAIRYLLRYFRELGRFLRFATIAPDNNIAEAGLRRVALGRKNFLFVGNEDAGHDLAVLYTLVACCEKHGVNPLDYVTDVLTRVHSHPATKVLDLLPHRWKAPDR
ncbi:MAG: IS66 family transposase [Polyangiaceae bacterium]